MNKITISLGSVTYAIKAQKLLSGIKIHSKLIKLDAVNKLDGCIYGLIVAAEDYPNAVVALKKEGIAFSVFS